MTVVFVHSNPLRLTACSLIVDRKFHEGMLRFVEALNAPVLTINPLAQTGSWIMDPVELARDSLPYRVVAIETDQRNIPTAAAAALIEDAVAASTLVIGYGYRSEEAAARLGRPFIAQLEYDLQTQLTTARSFARGPLRAAWSMLRCLKSYYGTMVPVMRQARAIHCNGYPIYREGARYNLNRLLYLDSRMSEQMVIPASVLEQRLSSRCIRPIRLLFSGRFERMKGALDAVQVAAKCLQRGMAVEMDCYGQGSLSEAMRTVAAKSNGRIRVNSVVPFPELALRAQQADIFVCCHIQSDPSCTYVEAMGSGLPIVGYRNRMWEAMAASSDAGRVTGRNSVSAAAGLISALVNDSAELDRLSRNARQFALAHSFEHEFRTRTNAINAALE